MCFDCSGPPPGEDMRGGPMRGPGPGPPGMRFRGPMPPGPLGNRGPMPPRGIGKLMLVKAVI